VGNARHIWKCLVSWITGVNVITPRFTADTSEYCLFNNTTVTLSKTILFEYSFRVIKYTWRIVLFFGLLTVWRYHRFLFSVCNGLLKCSNISNVRHTCITMAGTFGWQFVQQVCVTVILLLGDAVAPNTHSIMHRQLSILRLLSLRAGRRLGPVLAKLYGLRWKIPARWRFFEPPLMPFAIRSLSFFINGKYSNQNGFKNAHRNCGPCFYL
jgi:hypothetical protein